MFLPPVFFLRPALSAAPCASFVQLSVFVILRSQHTAPTYIIVLTVTIFTFSRTVNPAYFESFLGHTPN